MKTTATKTAIATPALKNQKVSLFQEVEATISETIAQQVEKNGEFFLKVVPTGIVRSIQSAIIKEEVEKGTHVTIMKARPGKPAWEMSLQEAKDYLVAQQEATAIYSEINDQSFDTNPEFNKAWDGKDQTIGHKMKIEVEGKTYNMYIVLNTYVYNFKKTISPSLLLITEKSYNPKQAKIRMAEIVEERKEYQKNASMLEGI